MDPLTDFMAVVDELEDSWDDPSRVDQLAERLLHIGKTAASVDPNVIYLCASLMNLLVDLNERTEISVDDAREFLRRIASDPHGTFLHPPNGSVSEFVLRGTKIDSAMTDRELCGMCAWPKFCYHHAGSMFGHSAYSDIDIDKLWSRAETTALELPDDQVLRLDGRNRCVWFTDESMLRTKCGAHESVFAATAAYELLGLDWQDWEAVDVSGRALCRAALISCTGAARTRAARGLRVPTAVDAWGHMLFSPLAGGIDGEWHGGCTQHALDGSDGVPEGIHGPVEVIRGEATVSAAGTVMQPHAGARLKILGTAILERIRRRLATRGGTDD